jgi:hypothetical protein
VPYDVLIPGALTAGDLDDVAAALAALEDPESGERVLGPVLRAGEAFAGPALADAPDLVVLPRPGYDPKGMVGAGAVFARSRLTGMHTFADAVCFARGGAGLPERCRLEDVGASVLAHLGGDTAHYTLPPRRGTRLKVGDHRFSLRGDPDGPRLATDADLERLRRAARVAYRDFDSYAEIERKACFYTVEPRERFVVRPLGARGWLVSACSGHGFKLQPLITEGVAQAIAGERPAADLPAWAAGETEAADRS